jgi:hypothetical protein
VAPAIQGCPSRAFPVHPGSSIRDFAEITLGSDHGMTTGCWTTYDEPASTTANDIFRFYTDPANVAGWKLNEAYPSTGYASFSSVSVPHLRADVGIAPLKRYFVVGPTTLTYAISICLCDPRSMAQ